jgi:hypothetical protein
MRVIYLVVLIGLSGTTIAQSGYQAGFLLTTGVDTVYGLIRFSGKANVPTPCLFKLNKKSTAKEINPGTVQGFGTRKGAYFFSRSIGRSSDVFLEVLVKGRMSLYRFGDIYFVEQADKSFFELSDEYELVEIEGERLRKKSRNFTRMLSVLMGDCPEASKKASSVKLQEKSLIGLVSMYNACKGSRSKYFRIKVKQ